MASKQHKFKLVVVYGQVVVALQVGDIGHSTDKFGGHSVSWSAVKIGGHLSVISVCWSCQCQVW